MRHFGPGGDLLMVDVSHKESTVRTARAQARVRLGAEAAKALRDATLAKGDALVAAQLAGILAAKQTPALIPLAHAIPLGAVNVEFSWDGDVLGIEAVARTRGGACRLREKDLVIIDRDQPASEQLEVLAEALRSRDLEALYLSPAARRIVHVGETQS